MQFTLMHKNVPCGTIAYDKYDNRIVGYKDAHTGASPFLGNMDLTKLKMWWNMRTASESREGIREILRNTGCGSAEEFLIANRAVSISDTYWICPEEVTPEYDPNWKIPYHNASSFDPNASLGGQMEKYWEFTPDGPVLVKESSKFFGQQSINEVMASYIHRLQGTDVPYVEYSASMTEDNSILCRCRSFTSETLEFVPAYEVVESQKLRNDRPLYDQYIDLCTECGIDRGAMQDFMDYQTLTDFIISNTDEHLLNFGILRDPDTLRFISPAPIFDSGNSMFFNENRSVPYTRVELLERKITGFYASEEKMLARIQNRNIVKTGLLPTPAEVRNLYLKAGIPEQKASFIEKNYETKIRMVQEFQRGITISLFHEKKAAEAEKKTVALRPHTQKFIMLCGIPGSGKTAQAEQIVEEMRREGRKVIPQESLYSMDRILESSGLFINRRALENMGDAVGDLSGCVAVISANGIREELSERAANPENNFVFSVVDLRIKTALAHHADVVYDATNVDIAGRRHFINLVDSVTDAEKILFVMDASPENVVTDQPQEKVEYMHQLLSVNYPSLQEGWTEIREVYSPELVAGEKVDLDYAGQDAYDEEDLGQDL